MGKGHVWMFRVASIVLAAIVLLLPTKLMNEVTAQDIPQDTLPLGMVVNWSGEIAGVTDICPPLEPPIQIEQPTEPGQ